MSEKETPFTPDALSANSGDKKLPGMAGYDYANHLDELYKRPTMLRDTTDYVDTSVRTYEAETDLSGLPTTTFEMKGRACPLRVIDTDTASMAQQELRDLLMAKYPEQEYPDIHKLLQSGLLLTRFFSEERLPIAQMSGTDRDFLSTLSYHGETGEEQVVRANNLDRSRVTYLAQQRTSSRSLDGGEPMVNFGSLYGNVLLVYDPRYVQRLGSTSSGLSYFPEGAHRALLAIVRSPKQAGS
jgi:hypothetical protein